MKKLLVAIVVTLVVVLLVAPTAFAAKPAPDPNCSFDKGKTTCTETKLVNSYYSTEQVGWTTDDCGGLFPQRVPLLQDYRVDVYQTTTTVYKGKSDNVVSTDPKTSEDRSPVGEPYPGC